VSDTSPWDMSVSPRPSCTGLALGAVRSESTNDWRRDPTTAKLLSMSRSASTAAGSSSCEIRRLRQIWVSRGPTTYQVVGLHRALALHQDLTARLERVAVAE